MWIQSCSIWIADIEFENNSDPSCSHNALKTFHVIYGIATTFICAGIPSLPELFVFVPTRPGQSPWLELCLPLVFHFALLKIGRRQQETGDPSTWLLTLDSGLGTGDVREKKSSSIAHSGDERGDGGTHSNSFQCGEWGATRATQNSNNFFLFQIKWLPTFPIANRTAHSTPLLQFCTASQKHGTGNLISLWIPLESPLTEPSRYEDWSAR